MAFRCRDGISSSIAPLDGCCSTTRRSASRTSSVACSGIAGLSPERGKRHLHVHTIDKRPAGPVTRGWAGSPAEAGPPRQPAGRTQTGHRRRRPEARRPPIEETTDSDPPPEAAVPPALPTPGAWSQPGGQRTRHRTSRRSWVGHRASESSGGQAAWAAGKPSSGRWRCWSGRARLAPPPPGPDRRCGDADERARRTRRRGPRNGRRRTTRTSHCPRQSAAPPRRPPDARVRSPPRRSKAARAAASWAQARWSSRCPAQM